MAEKTDELTRMDNVDAVAESSDAGSDTSLTRSAATDADSTYYDSGAPDETEHIRAKIEQTRSQMGETIDAIQDRLSLANISDQVSEKVGEAIETAKDKAYDATVGKAVNFMKNVGDEVTHSGAFKMAKKNPLPFALIGVGAGLLAYQAYSGSTRRGNGRAYPKGSYEYENGETSHSRLTSAKKSIGDTMHRAYDGISDRANSAIESVSTAAESGYERVTGAVSNAYAGAEDFAHRAYDRAGEYGTMVHDKYDQTLEENPLALGAVALAIGAAVGFAIPSTSYEGKLMGDARDKVMRRAQSAAGELVDRAKQVAGEAGQTIKEETQGILGH